MADQDSLEHHGIKGMKWGIRRSRDELARLRGEKAPPSEDAIKARDLQKRVKRSGTKSLSNKEFKDLNARLNLETNYKKMTTTKKKEMSKGEKQALKNLGLVGLQVVGAAMMAKHARRGAQWAYDAWFSQYNNQPAVTSVVRKAIER